MLRRSPRRARLHVRLARVRDLLLLLTGDCVAGAWWRSVAVGVVEEEHRDRAEDGGGENEPICRCAARVVVWASVLLRDAGLYGRRDSETHGGT